MGPRLASGSAPSNVATLLVLLLLAVGAAMAGNDVLAAPRLPASASELPLQFEAQPPCLVLVIDLSGTCPLPAVPAAPFTRRATIFLCAESLCGRGFRPGDVITLLARTADGSTFWRTRADRGGNFRSPLPSPLCHFTPVGLMALGDHTGPSNRLSLASTGCTAFKN
jgi:hypothetical protein